MAEATTGAAPESRDETLDLPDWLLLFDGGAITDFLDRMRNVFRRVYVFTLAALGILIPLSILLNQTEARYLNVIPVFVLAALFAYHALEPYKFLAWFGFGVIKYGGLPNGRIGDVLRLRFPDFRIDEFVRAGGRGVKFGWDLFSVVWLFLFMWFMVAATIPADAGPAYMLLATLLGWGAISIRWPSAGHWYRRICTTITLLLTILFLFQAFVAKTSIWRVVSSPAITAQHVVVSTTPVPLSHFVDRAQTGSLQEAERHIQQVPDGCYTFTATGPDVVFTHRNQTTALGDIVRLNGYDQNWPFLVEGGRVTVSFDDSFGQGRIAGGSYEVVNITLTPSRSCA